MSHTYLPTQDALIRQTPPLPDFTLQTRNNIYIYILPRLEICFHLMDRWRVGWGGGEVSWLSELVE